MTQAPCVLLTVPGPVHTTHSVNTYEASIQLILQAELIPSPLYPPSTLEICSLKYMSQILSGCIWACFLSSL